LYRALTGHYPFYADSPEGYLRAHLHTSPTPPRTYNPRIPERLEAIILTALEKRASRRFRTADQMGRVLLEFLNEPASPATDAAAAHRRALAGDEHPIGSPKTPNEAEATPEASTQPLATKTAPPTTPITAAVAGGVMPPQTESVWDPVTLALAILALIAVVGLVPLWLWVFFLFSH